MILDDSIEKLCFIAGIPPYNLRMNTIHDENFFRELRAKNSHPLVVLGNGPSVKEIDYSRYPNNPVVFRSNHFFSRRVSLFRSSC